MKATSSLILLMALVAGCKNSLDVYESKAPKSVVLSTNADGLFSLASRALSSDVVLVTGAVQRVDFPLVNSPSLAGDKATCVLLVPARSIPAHPDFCRIALHYDNHGLLQGIKSGSELVLRFQKSGEFDGVLLPSNFIQQSGPANGSQPIRSETNSTSSAAGSRR